MSRSTLLEKNLITPVLADILQLQQDLANLQNGTLAPGDNVSELVNDADYQTLTELKTEIDAAINNLIDSAPGTLDTLGEIAAALQNDENAVSSLIAQDTQHTNDITALQNDINTILASLTVLDRQRKVNAETLTADKVLVPTDFAHQVYTVSTDTNVTLPTEQLDLSFAIKNAIASTANLLINGEILTPGDTYEVISDGSSWIVI